MLKEQHAFAEWDSSSTAHFLNVFDKGHWCALAAKTEKQTCVQPKFWKNGKQFKRNQTLHTACVAVVRAGNERAASRAKVPWLLKRGTVDQLWDVGMFADVWLAWGFQINFVCDTVL
jgi:hypothetical protein